MSKATNPHRRMRIVVFALTVLLTAALLAAAVTRFVEADDPRGATGASVTGAAA